MDLFSVVYPYWLSLFIRDAYMTLDQIYNQDCLLGMQTIDNETIDLLLTDPPYNISQRSGFHTMGRTGVDFGEWDKDFDQEEWLKLACSKIKRGGSAIVFNDYKNIGQMNKVFNECGMTTKELLVWQKPNPMPRNRDRLYVTTIEVALWAVKGKGWTFNRQKETYENGIFHFGTVNSRVRKHPTEKPLGLIVDLLRIHSNKGDVVLDPFSGSGTVSVACRRLDRHYLAFEVDKGYYDVSVARMDDEIRLEHGIFI